MRLLSIVLLCSYCFLGSANQASTEEADCDDQTVFQAANEVLRSFNDAKEDGSQFVLYRITEARKKEETGRIHIFITFKIQESVCQVKNGIYWQRCAFKGSEADYGECSAHILVNTELKSEEIITQNCSITKGGQPEAPKPPVLEPIVTVVHHTCLGCFQAIDANSETVLPIMQLAIEKMNREGNHQFHFGLENITRATRQVVSGWNYRLDYKIRQTNCSKSEVPKWIPKDCSLDENGQEGKCNAAVFVTPYEEIKDINLNCHSSTGYCLSCPGEVEPSDPELQNLLKTFMEEYNTNNNHTYLYKVKHMETESMKLVQNQKQYKMKFRIQGTNCTKSKHSILGEDCDIESQSVELNCNVNINVENETVDILPDYICESPLSPSRIVIKGLSPLRIATLRSQRSISHSSKRKGNEPDHEHGKKDKKDKKDKGGKKHNGKHDDSSEESEEDNRKMPQILPGPTKQAIPSVPEIDTSVLVTTSQQASPTDTDKVHGPPLNPPPTPFTPNILHTFPLRPTVPEQQGPYPNIHETVILDLPGPVPDVPKCPGKLWQPLLPILQITTDKPFVIEDLLFSEDDLLPKSEKQLPSLDSLDTAGLPNLDNLDLDF